MKHLYYDRILLMLLLYGSLSEDAIALIASQRAPTLKRVIEGVANGHISVDESGNTTTYTITKEGIGYLINADVSPLLNSFRLEQLEEIRTYHEEDSDEVKRKIVSLSNTACAASVAGAIVPDPLNTYIRSAPAHDLLSETMLNGERVIEGITVADLLDTAQRERIVKGLDATNGLDKWCDTKQRFIFNAGIKAKCYIAEQTKNTDILRAQFDGVLQSDKRSLLLYSMLKTPAATPADIPVPDFTNECRAAAMFNLYRPNEPMRAAMLIKGMAQLRAIAKELKCMAKDREIDHCYLIPASRPGLDTLTALMLNTSDEIQNAIIASTCKRGIFKVNGDEETRRLFPLIYRKNKQLYAVCPNIDMGQVIEIQNYIDTHPDEEFGVVCRKDQSQHFSTLLPDADQVVFWNK